MAKRFSSPRPTASADAFTTSGRRRRRLGMVRHFFPVVDGAALPRQGCRRGLADRRRASAHRTSSSEPRADRVSTKDPGQLSRPGAAGICRRSGKLLSCQRRFGLRACRDRAKAWRRRRRPSSRAATGSSRSGFRRCRRKQYLVAVDPAGGGSEGDYSAVEVLEMEAGCNARSLPATSAGWNWRSS